MSNFYAYPDAKDPAATRPFTFDFGPQLADGVTIQSVTATMISAAGCSFVGAATFSGTVSRVYLSGGDVGGDCVYEITVDTTDGPEQIVFGFSVKVADAAAEPTELDRLKELRAALQTAQLAAVGGSVQEVWNGRYGNKMKYVTMTYDQIKAALKDVNNMIADEERVAAGGSRRGGGVGIVWAH